jgi:drug/metabolite transporter (DMT)-like permease
MKSMQLSENNAKTGNLIFLSPFLSLVFIHFILGETIYITTFIGLAFIISGIWYQQKQDVGQKSEGKGEGKGK